MRACSSLQRSDKKTRWLLARARPACVLLPHSSLPQISAAEREQAYNEARQRILYGLTAEQQQQQQQQQREVQMRTADRSGNTVGGGAAESDCYSAQEVAMAAAAAVFGGDDDR